MGLVALLLANGVGLLAAERAASRTPAAGWMRLRAASVASIVLWLTILFMGPWLTAAA